MLFNPWFIIGAICTVLGVYFYGHHSGYQERVAEDQAEIARLNEEARAKEVDLNKKITQTTIALLKAKNDVKTKQSTINARIDSGELHLPSSCAIQASTDASTARGDSANDSQSDRQVIKDIVFIATEGDTAITQLNACIDTYNKVGEMVNVKP